MTDPADNGSLPNPSSITQGAIDKAIESSRAVITARIDGMQKAQDLFQADLTRVPTTVDRQITALRELFEARLKELMEVTTERFVGVGSQFFEKKLAVDMAFAAAKEATNKIETGFTKQIDGMNSLIDTKTSNLSGGLSDLKDRMTAMENRTVGITAARTDSRHESLDSRALVFSIISVSVSLAVLILLIMNHFGMH